MIKLVVFDFDGTLVDTKKFLLEVIEKRLCKIGIGLTKAFIEHFGDNPLKKSLSTIIVDKELVSRLADELHSEFIKHSDEIKANKNLKKLKDIEKKKIILSNSVEGVIRPVLKNLNANFFEEIHGADSIIDKLSELKLIMRKELLKPEEIVYIGDRPVDVRLAKAAGCISVAISNKVSWSSKKEIIMTEPDFLIADLSELKRVIKQMDKKVLI